MNNDILCCSVAIENTVNKFDKLFDYIVPDNLQPFVKPGVRVSVPFGRANKTRQSMVMSISYKPLSETEKLKQIKSVLDSSPVMTEEMLLLAEFMKERYFCTYYDAIKAMLPAGINYRVTSVYSLATAKPQQYTMLSEEYCRIVDFFKRNRTPQRLERLLDVFGYKDSAVFDELVRMGILTKSEDSFRRTGDKTMKMVAICEDLLDDGIKLTPKQNEVLSLLQTAGQCSVKEICYFTGVTQSVVDSLVKKGIAFYYNEEVMRSPIKNGNYSKSDEITLTEHQQNAYDSLLSNYKSQKPCVSLLYGITGSGKTSVFMKLIDTVVADGKSVIVMVPEIALTPQLISLFSARFGKNVAVIHSGLSLGERVDEYKRILNGEAKIVVGTRSAVFAPFKNIGLIIIDEEQETTYKSENTPRYHARDVAKFRCMHHSCMLLLSSATPDVESYYYAKTGRYSLTTLTKRYGNAVLPQVDVADMNEEVSAGNTTGFSSELLEAIEENLNNGRQSIILLNRRGHNTFVMCPVCKEAVTCPNCSISLTYHSANNRMMCHYCGYSVPYTDKCPTCHSKGLRFGGAGTQRAEQQLYDLFSDARILRMDTDTTMSKSAHEKKIGAFANGDYDILVGTQMVAKGLNFPNVTLVGVLNADQTLYSDDYRSFERGFSLMTQVVGRSGRGDKMGRAIIQTYTPENPIIYLAAEQDYDKFFESEIKIRKAMLYPPFADICLVGFVGQDSKETVDASKAFLSMLISLAKEKYDNMPLRVLGPSAAAVVKVNNKYRYKIIVKCRNDKRFREMLRTLLSQFSENRQFAKITVTIDTKPLYF